MRKFCCVPSCVYLRGCVGGGQGEDWGQDMRGGGKAGARWRGEEGGPRSWNLGMLSTFVFDFVFLVFFSFSGVYSYLLLPLLSIILLYSSLLTLLLWFFLLSSLPFRLSLLCVLILSFLSFVSFQFINLFLLLHSVRLYFFLFFYSCYYFSSVFPL